MTSPPPSASIDRAMHLEQLQATLRAGQLEMAQWRGGTLAVSAVPGAGKSYGLSVAAAIALATQHCPSSKQLLLVTFTRSAALSLKRQVRAHLKTLEVSQGNFSVQTLHGLAFSIATQHPQASGLRMDQLSLVSPTASHRLIRDTVDQWIQAYPRLYQGLLQQGNFDGEDTERLRRHSVLTTDVLPGLAHIAIREAKSSGLQPEDLFALAQSLPTRSQIQQGEEATEIPILAIAAGLFQQYETLLRASHQIDYDDMIRAALRALSVPAIRDLWQGKVHGVFEDEAQDSSPLQAQLLEIIATNPSASASNASAPNASPAMNLIRVGDSNQAINSTFTPADPRFFRRFCERNQAQGSLARMSHAGRSSPVIIQAANRLVQWVNQSQQTGSVQPFQFQEILPLPLQDQSQNQNHGQNPAPLGDGVEISRPQDIFETAQRIAARILELQREQPQDQPQDQPQLSFAILVRENKQGQFLAEVLSHPAQYGLTLDLRQAGLRIYEASGVQRRSSVPQDLLTLLKFLAYPHSPNCLKAALALLIKHQRIPDLELDRLTPYPENFLAPTPLQPPLSPAEQQAQQFCHKVLRARWELPRFQLIPFLALTLNYSPEELATADKLASRLAQMPGQGFMEKNSMGHTLEAIQTIIDSERFDPIELEPEENRYIRPNQVTILSMHKAKGLDWDVVFLPFLHATTIPGSLWVPSQAKFLGEVSLSEVARAQIRAYIHQEPIPDMMTAWTRANDLKIAEEFRLLYVAMTRPKRLLWMSACHEAPFSWGRYAWSRQDALSPQPPLAFLELVAHDFRTDDEPYTLT